MAVRELTASEQAAIKAYGDAWGKAYAAGDTKGMEAAHAGAEAVRAQAGYSGGADGSQTIALPSTSTGSSSSGGSKTSSSGSKTSSSGNSQYSGGTTSWQPADTSGNNYASMAGMSALHQAALEAAGKSWQEAYARGDQAGMDAAHAQAESIRSLYGYSGGNDGSQYILSGNTNPGFEYETAPTYTDSYSARIDELLNQILNRDDFSYNALDDPLYQQYSKQYQREGQRAMQDTLGQVSARTGGMASSYAISAAQQANNYYASQLTDKIPELYQLAYSMYLDDIDLKVQDLGLLEGASDRQYSRYRDTMSDWRDDRDFAYGLYRDDINDDRYANEWAYQVGQDAIANQQWQQSFDRGVFESDRDYDYGVGRDDIEDGRYNKTEAQAQVQSHILEMGGSAAELPEEVIKASGYSPAELAAMERTYAENKAAQNAKNVTGGNPKVVDDEGDGDDGLDDSKLTADQIKKMQNYFGITADGVWGPTSKSATGGLDADAAWKAYNKAVAETLNLGIGPVTGQFVAELADKYGAIVENSDGSLEWAPGWSATNYQEKIKAIDAGIPFGLSLGNSMSSIVGGK